MPGPGVVALSWLSSLARGLAGTRVASSLGPRPAQPLELYDFEACPFCRKVRELLTALDLSVRIWPCPKGGTRYREKARALGGAARFPFLVDPNTGKQLYESGVIGAYLAQTYGDGAVPFLSRATPVATVSSVLATTLRPTGRHARPSKAPGQPLELYGFEGSPQSRLVRGVLCELELPYLLHNVAKGSARRADFVARSGRDEVPFLVDPNAGVSLFGAADITRHLEATYAAGT
jgi:glutathione S-transferase